MLIKKMLSNILENSRKKGTVRTSSYFKNLYFLENLSEDNSPEIDMDKSIG